MREQMRGDFDTLLLLPDILFIFNLLGDAMKLIFAMALLPLLVACVTEEGERRHSTQVDVDWHSIVYKKPGSNVQGKSVGIFSSRDECATAAMAHIKEKNMRRAIYACNAKSEI